jgi:hypothetical protein
VVMPSTLARVAEMARPNPGDDKRGPARGRAPRAGVEAPSLPPFIKTRLI